MVCMVLITCAADESSLFYDSEHCLTCQVNESLSQKVQQALPSCNTVGHRMDPDRTCHCSINRWDEACNSLLNVLGAANWKHCKGMLTAACKKSTCLPQHAEDSTRPSCC